MKASQEEANKEGVPITLMCGESSTVSPIQHLQPSAARVQFEACKEGTTRAHGDRYSGTAS